MDTNEATKVLLSISPFVRQFVLYLVNWGQSEEENPDIFKVMPPKVRTTDFGAMEIFCPLTCSKPQYSEVMLPFEVKTLALVRRIEKSILRKFSSDKVPLVRPYVRPISNVKLEIGFRVHFGEL